MTHVLLTNDDGVGRAGLNAMRASLVEVGCAVTVVAPDGNRSGAARSITCRTPVQVRPVGDRRNRVFETSGTPVDCVRVGLLSGLVEPIDIVVAGINHGINLGDDLLYSGTAGAAIEGALLGWPAVAVSQQGVEGGVPFIERDDYAFALAPAAAQIVRAIAEDPPPGRSMVNLNLPTGCATAPVAVTRPGARRYARGWATADRVDGGWEVRPYGAPRQPAPACDCAEGTDFRAVLDGHIALSALSLDWPSAFHHDVLAHWAAALAGTSTAPPIPPVEMR